MFGVITNSCIEPVRDEIQKLNFFQNLALREFGVELHDFDSIRTLNNAVVLRRRQPTRIENSSVRFGPLCQSNIFDFGLLQPHVLWHRTRKEFCPQSSKLFYRHSQQSLEHVHLLPAEPVLGTSLILDLLIDQ